MGWLKCDGDEVEFFDSVVTFVHELDHQLRKNDDQCIYSAAYGNYICFDFPESLPPRSFGKLGSFPTRDEKAIRALRTVQKIYLTDIDENLLLLLDELNAYTLSVRNYVDLYRRKGESACSPDLERRTTRG